MKKENILKIKSITKKIIEHHNTKVIEVECESPVESPRNADEFVKFTGEYIIVDGLKYKLVGIGYTIPKIIKGERIKIFFELKKGGKVNGKNKKHKSKS